jgi:hypothetical protein
MSYEGFQLLPYDYNEIHVVKKNLLRVMLSAVAGVYDGSRRYVTVNWD